MELTEEWAMQNAVNALPLPSAATFQRAVREKIPPETLCFTREGPREWWTLYSPSIARRYGNMVSNQMWVGDTYTLAIFTLAESGQVHRLYLSAWVDARSGIFTGWSLSGESKSQNSVNAVSYTHLYHFSIHAHVLFHRDRFVFFVKGKKHAVTQFFDITQPIHCHNNNAVSYTHLDVYKRQALCGLCKGRRDAE